MYNLLRACLALTLISLGYPTIAQADSAAPIRLDVDARDAARRILHAHLVIPAQPGPFTLFYPKWIPGEHAPSGPIVNLAGLKMSSGDTALAWQRDPLDMFTFHCQVPAESTNLEVRLDFLLSADTEGFSSGASATPRLVVINWNQLVLYPSGTPPAQLQYAVRLRLPADWHSGTALPLAAETEDGIRFAPVSLVTLIDSPLLAGLYFRTVELSPGRPPRHQLHLAADSPADLEIRPEDVAHYSQLVAETGALFGARHYRGYHFLLSLSDHVAHFGLEHHESSDDRTSERTLIDDELRKVEADLLPHEMVHSWNGKFRRPSGLCTADYQQLQDTSLLWIYEGLTTYLGNVLATRCGLWTPALFEQSLALEAAALDYTAGRTWRPLLDTTVAAQVLYDAPTDWAHWRRWVDFYPEGLLIWLEADVIIRQRSEGRRSLDDFCRRFAGGTNGPPELRPYRLDEVVNTLNDIAPYDWRSFFKSRLNSTQPRAPLGGVESGGWRLVYRETVPEMLRAKEYANKMTDLSYSLGLLIKDDGTLQDVLPGQPAARAGLAPGMKLVAVNGRRWSSTLLREAIKAAKDSPESLELLLENSDFFKTFSIPYHGGERYPYLERDASKPDLLDPILQPRAAP